MFEARHHNRYENVAWLIARWMKRKGAGSQKESMICYGQFITKSAKRKSLLSEEVLNSLSALIYYRALDTTTLRELIDSKGRLIPEFLELGVLRVAIPRPQRASMQDLYERMGSMEIRQGAIERMAYRQELTTYLVMISSSTRSIIGNTHLSSSSQMMMSVVEMTREIQERKRILYKTEHGMEERQKDKVKSKPKTKKSKLKSTPQKSTVKAEAETEEMLNGPPVPI
ncbi:hypothetical protein Tco_0309226 [Tanacetum coccineum]